MRLRQFNKNERRMFAVLLTALFLLVNLYGLDFLVHQRQALEEQIPKLNAQKKYNELWLSQKELWNKRQEWLNKTQPKLNDLSQGNVELLTALQGLAKDNNLTIAEQSLLDPRKTSAYQEVTVQLRLVGSLESLCRWLVSVQQPNQFNAITNFSLRTDTDITKIRCDLRISKWYQTN